MQAKVLTDDEARRDAFSRTAARQADIEAVDLRGADLADVGEGAHGGS
jgi:hypothetical protein